MEPKLVDTVRIMHPNLLAEQLVNVQPMDSSIGEVFNITAKPRPWYSKIYLIIRRGIRKMLGLYKYHQGCFGGYWD